MEQETTTQLPLARVKTTHVTLTKATAEAIFSAIQAGTFKPGSQLPTEYELIEMLGVSRTTLREALKYLEQMGMIYRQRGHGTFVSERSILKDLGMNYGISDMIRQAGYRPGNIEVDLREEPANTAIANALDVSEGQPVVVIERVRTANQRPAVYSLDYFPTHLVNLQAAREYIQQEESLYTYFREKNLFSVTYGQARLLPVAANSIQAARLNVHRGTALMCLVQTDYSSDDCPLLHSVEYYLPDTFVFSINRKGPHI